MTEKNHLQVEENLMAAAKSIYPSDSFSTELWQRMVKENQSKAATGFLFKRVFKIAAFSLAVLTFAILVIGPQRVLAEVNQLIGYIPGIGFFANDSQTLYLSEPVTTQQDGVILTVKQAVADKNLLVIDYEITGLTDKQPAGTGACFYDSNEVILPDGTRKHVTGGYSSGIEDGIQARVEFLALPISVKNITLVAGMLERNSECKAPAQLLIDLPLVIAPADISVADVNEFPAVEQASGDNQANEQPIPSNSNSDIQFTIDRMVTLPDGYVLAGHITWGNKEWKNIWPEFDRMKIVDANGANVPFEQANDVNGENEFGIRIIGKDFQFPLNLSISAVLVNGSPDESPVFTFDSGKNPQIGQEWEIGQELNIFGKRIKIISAKVVQDTANPEKDLGFAFTIENDPQIRHIFLEIMDREKYGDSFGQIRMNGQNSLILENYFAKELPTGKVIFKIMTVDFEQENKWEIQINPAQ